MKGFTDLHVHSLVSDGSMTPREIAAYAQERGLTAFALTDHDNISGDKEAERAARERGLGFIPGMELSAQFRGHKIHIVCLGFDAEHPAFQKLYRKVRSAKEAKIPEIVDYVRAKGIDITMDDVRAHAYGVPDRYAIMRCLVALHLYDHAQPLWDNYLDPAVHLLGLDAIVAPEEALPAIHAAGGITSLAHFHKRIGLKGETRERQDELIGELHALGLDGMECWYPNYTADDRAFAAHMIEKYNLLPTAGTDFHGTNRPEIDLGSGLGGELCIDDRVFTGVAERVTHAVVPEGITESAEKQTLSALALRGRFIL